MRTCGKLPTPWGSNLSSSSIIDWQFSCLCLFSTSGISLRLAKQKWKNYRDQVGTSSPDSLACVTLRWACSQATIAACCDCSAYTERLFIYARFVGRQDWTRKDRNTRVSRRMHDRKVHVKWVVPHGLNLRISSHGCVTLNTYSCSPAVNKYMHIHAMHKYISL